MNGTHQCDFSNFCGALGLQQSKVTNLEEGNERSKNEMCLLPKGFVDKLVVGVFEKPIIINLPG